MPCRSPFGLRLAAAVVVLAAALPRRSRTPRRRPSAVAHALVTQATPATSGRLLATAPTDTPVFVNPFTVMVDAARQTIPLRENPAAATVVAEASKACPAASPLKRP